MPAFLRRLWPSTLLARVTLLVVVGMALAQVLTYTAIRYERGQTLMNLMVSGVERDIASSVAILDRLPAAERAGWFQRLERPNYRFSLEGVGDMAPPSSPALARFADIVTNALRPFPVVAVGQLPQQPETACMQVRLNDGSSLYVLARRVPMPVADWVTWLLLAQLLVLAACAWAGMRLVTRPLAQLARAADRLGPASPRWRFDEATYQRSAQSFDNPDHVAIVVHNYRWRIGLAAGEPRFDALEQRLATAPVIAVPTITMEGDANGAPHPDPAAYAKKFSGKYQHRQLDGGIGHNLPQEAPAAFAQAVIDVTRL